jgi:hypothetical protein
MNNMIEYTEKTGIINTLGNPRTEFPNGAKVMVKSYVNGKPAEVQGVNISAKFDFDPETWYTANLTQADVDKFLAVGKSVNIKTWSKEANGKTYHNFAIMYPKKPDVAQVEAKFNPLIQKVEQHGKQLMSLYAMIQALQAKVDKKESTTMFDDDALEVHGQDAYETAFGPIESQDEVPLEAYDNPADIPWE